VMLAIRFDTVDTETLSKWFSMLHTHAPRCVVFLLAYSYQSFPPSEHWEMVANLSSKCEDLKGDLNIALIDLVNLKNGKSLKNLKTTIVDSALRSIPAMSRPVPRGAIQLEKIISNGIDMTSPVHLPPTLDDGQGQVLDMRTWAELCSLCEMKGKEDQAEALKLLAWWGSILHISPGVLGQEPLAVLSVPWFFDKLISINSATSLQSATNG